MSEWEFRELFTQMPGIFVHQIILHKVDFCSHQSLQRWSLFLWRHGGVFWRIFFISSFYFNMKILRRFLSLGLHLQSHVIGWRRFICWRSGVSVTVDTCQQRVTPRAGSGHAGHGVQSRPRDGVQPRPRHGVQSPPGHGVQSGPSHFGGFLVATANGQTQILLPNIHNTERKISL